jgi:hypothetical protein
MCMALQWLHGNVLKVSSGLLNKNFECVLKPVHGIAVTGYWTFRDNEYEPVCLLLQMFLSFSTSNLQVKNNYLFL